MDCGGSFEREGRDRDGEDDFASGGVVLALVVLVSDLDDLASGRRSERLAERDCTLNGQSRLQGQSPVYPMSGQITRCPSVLLAHAPRSLNCICSRRR